MRRRETILDPKVVKIHAQASSPLDQVYETLRNAIVGGHLPHGQWLRQMQLADELGVSQTTVRHALNRLAAEGLVVGEPYKGFRTNIPTPAYMLDHGEVLRVLEPVALELSAGLISDQELDRMEELLPKTLPGDWELAVVHEADHEFHSIAFSACGREYLIHLLEQTWDKYHSVGIAALYSDDDLADWARSAGQYHPQILDALRAGDGARAAQACALLWEDDIRRDQAIFRRFERDGSSLP